MPPGGYAACASGVFSAASNSLAATAVSGDCHGPGRVGPVYGPERARIYPQQTDGTVDDRLVDVLDRSAGRQDALDVEKRLDESGIGAVGDRR